MIPKLAWFVALVQLLGAPLLGAADPAPGSQPIAYIDDPARLATSDVSWAFDMQAELADFEADSGIRVLLQFHPKSPPAGDDEKPGAYMRGLATKLGVIKRGVLLVYFADDPDWRVWIGDDLTPKFVGKTGSAPEFTENGAMHEAKEAFLKSSLAKADAAFSVLQKSARKDGPVPAGKQLTLQADALVEGMRKKLDSN